MRIKGQCPVCKSVCHECKRRIEEVQGVLRLECAYCGAIFFDTDSHPKPTYDLAYNMYFHRPSDIRKAGIMAEQLTQFIGPPLGKEKFLEVGSGNGLIPFLMQSMGYDATDLELDDEHAEYITTHLLIKTHVGQFEKYTSPDKYTLIYASHVLEHCIDPHTFLTSAMNNLKKGGVLFLDTPDVGFVKQYGTKWKHFRTRHPFEHVVLFREATLLYLAKKYNLKVIYSMHAVPFQSIQMAFEKQ